MTDTHKHDTWSCMLHMVDNIPRSQECPECENRRRISEITTKEAPSKPRKKQEDSGGSCDYYKLEAYSVNLGKTQTVECKDIMHELSLNHAEMNMFKEIWRTAAARKGKKKKGHTPLRGAEKIKFFADENLELIKAGR